MSTCVNPTYVSPNGIADLITEYVRRESKPYLSYETRIYLESLFRSPEYAYTPINELLFCDPVTHQPLSAAVGGLCMAPCGHTFNVETIYELFRKNQNFCPLDRTPMSGATIRPNHISTDFFLCAAEIQQLVKVFIEIQDRSHTYSELPTAVKLSSKLLFHLPPRLAAFNQKLFSKTWTLDRLHGLEKRFAEVLLRTFKLPIEEYVVSPCGHTNPKSSPKVVADCCSKNVADRIPNRILQEAISWVRTYAASGSWAERQVETLPGKAGLFLHLPLHMKTGTLIQEFARSGVFCKGLQRLCAENADDFRRGAVAKFQDLEELEREGTLADGVAATREAALPTLYIQFGGALRPVDTITSAGVPKPYIHLLMQVDRSSLNPELLSE